MRLGFAIALTAALFVCFSGAASAQTADDKKWVKQCMKDNKDEGAKESVVKAYCECMNDKMSDNETRSITQWEKANPEARKACERKAGWK